MTDFTSYMVPVATELWGAPRPGATPTEVRFGEGRTVNPKNGTAFDHGAEEGGGVLWLIERETGAKGRDAVAWLRERGFHVDDDPPSPARTGARDRLFGDPPFEPSRPAAAKPPKEEEPDDGAKKTLVKAWDYVDEHGAVLFQTLRYQWKRPDGSWRLGKDGKPSKTYSQRRKAATGEESRDGWVYSLKGARIVPYQTPALAEAIAGEITVFFVEGEKAADALRERGIPATCNPMGAGKWWDELTPHFDGAHVVIIPDADPQATKPDGSLRFRPDGRPMFVGQDHAEAVALAVAPVAASVRVLELPDLPPKGDVVEWFGAGGTVDRLYDLADAAPQADSWIIARAGAMPLAPAAPDYVSKFGAVTWAHMGDPGPQHEYLVEDLITRGELSMLAGPSGSGKSFLAIDLAMSVARGLDWMGRRVERGGVIYQAGESALGVRRRRLPAYSTHHGLTAADDVPFILLPAAVDLYGNADHVTALIAEIKHWSTRLSAPLELVVIDTFSAATPGADENSAKDMTVVLARCERIRKETGAAVLIVHHMNAAGEKPRGHTSIFANLDSVLICRKAEIGEGKSTVVAKDADRREVRELSIAKAKDGEATAKFRFVLRSVDIGSNKYGKPITSCVVAEPNKGGLVEDSPNAAGVKISNDAMVYLRAIDRSLAEHGVAAPASLHLPVGHRVVNLEKVRETFNRMTLEGQEEGDLVRRDDAIRQARKRHGAKLLKERVIGHEVIDGKSVMWLTGRKVLGFGGGAQVADTQASTPPDDRPPASDFPDDPFNDLSF